MDTDKTIKEDRKLKEESSSEETSSKMTPKSKRILKYVLTIAFMLAVTALALWYVLKDQETLNLTIQAIKEANVWFIILMIVFIIANLFIEGVVLMIFARLYKKSYKAYQGCLNGLIGSFFSAITPFSSGGQFVQAYTFSKQGVRPANAASILVMLFIVSQTVIVLYGTAAIIFGYQSTIVKMEAMQIFGLEISPIWLSFIGYAMNIITLGSMLLLAFCRPLHHFILTTGVNLGAKLHLIKNPKRKRTELAASVATFRIELQRLFKNAWILIIVLVLEIARSTFYNSLPYLAGLALGVDIGDKYFECLWSTSYLSMITCFIPTPGGSGASEGGFQLLFLSLFGDMTPAANILFRSISFYFSLFLGLIVFLFYRGSPKESVSNYNLHKTFVDLRIIAYADATKGEVEPILEEVEHNSLLKTQENNIKGKSLRETISLKINNKLMNSRKVDSSYAKYQAMPYITSDDIAKSFDDIKNTLIMNQEDIYADEESVDGTMIEYSKEGLQNLYSEISSIEAEKEEEKKKNSEVDKAIQEDLEALIAEEKKKKERQARRKEKKAMKKAQKEQTK